MFSRSVLITICGINLGTARNGALLQLDGMQWAASSNSMPSVVCLFGTCIDVFGLGGENAMYHCTTYDASFVSVPWLNLGGTYNSDRVLGSASMQIVEA
jgi:hypothetical protein